MDDRDFPLHLVELMGEVLKSTNGNDLEAAINLLINANQTFIYGVGRSGYASKSFAMRLVQMGMKAYFIGETVTPIVGPNDVVLIVSNTGETMSAIQTANIVRRVGARLIVLTRNRVSKLAHIANVLLVLDVDSVEFDHVIAPLGTLFENTALVYLDGLISLLMVRLGETDESMRKRHAIWV